MINILWIASRCFLLAAFFFKFEGIFLLCFCWGFPHLVDTTCFTGMIFGSSQMISIVIGTLCIVQIISTWNSLNIICSHYIKHKFVWCFILFFDLWLLYSNYFWYFVMRLSSASSISAFVRHKGGSCTLLGFVMNIDMICQCVCVGSCTLFIIV